jgi:hypothetical protein
MFNFLHKKGRLNNCSPAAQIRCTDLNVKTFKKIVHSTLLMRSSRVVRASDCQCQSCNNPGV